MVDSIAKFAGKKANDLKTAVQTAASDASSFAVTIQKIISNPRLIETYVTLAISKIIKPYYRKALEIIENLNKPQFPKLVQL